MKTSPKLQGRNITLKTYYYKVTLVRPETQDNRLFQCLDSQNPNKVCIAPSNFNNYKTIFSVYATLSTDNPTNPFANLDRLTATVFYDYPNLLGKKWVYFTMGGYTPIYVTEPNVPKPMDKK